MMDNARHVFISQILVIDNPAYT